MTGVSAAWVSCCCFCSTCCCSCCSCDCKVVDDVGVSPSPFSSCTATLSVDPAREIAAVIVSATKFVICSCTSSEGANWGSFGGDVGVAGTESSTTW